MKTVSAGRGHQPPLTTYRPTARRGHKRIKLLEQEAEVMRRAVGYLSRDANPK